MLQHGGKCVARTHGHERRCFSSAPKGRGMAAPFVVDSPQPGDGDPDIVASLRAATA